jgi:hypothetical protein
MKKKPTAKTIVFGGLNKIYTVSRDIAKQWGVETVPLNTLKEIIDKGKLEIDGELTEFKEAYNTTLGLVYSTCEDQAKKFGSKNVSVKYIKVVIEFTKEKTGL